MAEKQYVLAIDSGTQSVRAVLFDQTGNIILKESKPHKQYFSLNPNWAEQDPCDFWSKLCIVTRSLMSKLGTKKKLISCCALTSQRCVLIPVNKKGDPLRAAFSWFDFRDLPDFKMSDVSTELAVKGKKSKMNWVKYNEPDIYSETAYFLSAAGWISYKLTGLFVDSIGMQADFFVPFDLKNLNWHKKSIFYKVFGCKREQMPKLFKPGEVMGIVTKAASEETGLPIGLPIIASAGDKQCETLGSGCIRKGQFALSYGTASVIETTSYEYIKPPSIPYFYCLPSAIPDCWNIEFFLYRGYWLLTWFIKEFASSIPAIAKSKNKYTILDKEASKIPAGSKGLVVYPYWTPHLGLYPLAKGTVIGFTDIHTYIHFYRAILEGIAYALKDGIKFLSKNLDIKILEIMVSGGGSSSNLVMQITTDVFGMLVKRIKAAESCSLGAAINAAIAAGWFNSYKDAVKHMTNNINIFKPNQNNARVYNDIYKNVYKKVYFNLENIFPILKKYSD